MGYGLTVKELRNQLKDVPDETEVYIRCTTNICGNIKEARAAEKSTYGFFGKPIDCIIIEPEPDHD